MRCFNYCRVLLLITFLFSGSVNAASYSFQHGGNYYSTLSSACEAYRSNVQKSYPSTPITVTAYMISATHGKCDLRFASNNSLFASITLGRQGDSCAVEGATWNPSTGQCDEPAPSECEVKSGQPHPFTKSGGPGDPYASYVNGYLVANQSACFSGCAVNTADQKCIPRVSGAFVCVGTGYFTGQSCEVSGDGSLIDENTTAEPEPEPTTIADQVPCTYTTQSDGTQSCESLISEEKEGQYCGTVNGVKKCVDSKPTKDGISILTTVSTETDANGNTTTTKKDTATVTKCTGANQCASTSSTTTTVTKTDSNGNVTGVSGTCTGSACPDKNTNPDGDGDGLGDCVGDSCEDGEGGGPHDWYQPGEDTYASVIEGFADRVSDMPAVAGVNNFLTFTPSGTCPVYTVDVWVFNLRIDQFCTGEIPWDLIRAIVLGCCAFFAFRIAFL